MAPLLDDEDEDVLVVKKGDNAEMIDASGSVVPGDDEDSDST
jgi:hypothetical protein